MVSLSNNSAGTAINARFDNTLMKLSSNSAFNPIGSDIIKNEDPKFQNYFTQKMNLRVKDDSPAKKKGTNLNNNNTTKDIVGITRTYPATLGAYQ